MDRSTVDSPGCQPEVIGDHLNNGLKVEVAVGDTDGEDSVRRQFAQVNLERFNRQQMHRYRVA